MFGGLFTQYTWKRTRFLSADKTQAKIEHNDSTACNPEKLNLIFKIEQNGYGFLINVHGSLSKYHWLKVLDWI